MSAKDLCFLYLIFVKLEGTEVCEAEEKEGNEDNEEGDINSHLPPEFVRLGPPEHLEVGADTGF